LKEFVSTQSLSDVSSNRTSTDLQTEPLDPSDAADITTED
jgi:hypothetical protein